MKHKLGFCRSVPPASMPSACLRSESGKGLKIKKKKNSVLAGDECLMTPA